jgi:ADP-ribose pyrophosphatase YjhB (NUDIX family)
MIQHFDSPPNAASVALLHQQQVLLIRRARAPWDGAWTLPGGRLEPGETAEECAARELHEELGLRVYALRPLAKLLLGEVRQFRLQVFGTEAFEGEITPNEEIAAWRWVRAGGEASLRTTPHLSEVLERAFRLFDRS